MGSQPRTPAGPQSSEICPGFQKTPKASHTSPGILKQSPDLFRNESGILKCVLEFQNISPKVQNTV